jgi:hypothetical protein
MPSIFEQINRGTYGQTDPMQGPRPIGVQDQTPYNPRSPQPVGRPPQFGGKPGGPPQFGGKPGGPPQMGGPPGMGIFPGESWGPIMGGGMGGQMGSMPYGTMGSQNYFTDPPQPGFPPPTGKPGLSPVNPGGLNPFRPQIGPGTINPPPASALADVAKQAQIQLPAQRGGPYAIADPGGGSFGYHNRLY